MLQFGSLFLLLSLSIIQPSELNKSEEGKSSIEGIISNEHGTPVQNALIYLNKESKLINVTTSDTLGKYNFVAVKADTYTISVSYVGYFKKEIKDVSIGKGKNEVDIKMKELRCKHGDHTH